MQTDGGAAFPYKVTWNEGPKGDLVEAEPGMSLLDYYAGQALPWLLADTRRAFGLYDGQAVSVRPTPQHIAKAAFDLAEAMVLESLVRRPR